MHYGILKDKRKSINISYLCTNNFLVSSVVDFYADTLQTGDVLPVYGSVRYWQKKGME